MEVVPIHAAHVDQRTLQERQIDSFDEQEIIVPFAGQGQLVRNAQRGDARQRVNRFQYFAQELRALGVPRIVRHRQKQFDAHHMLRIESFVDVSQSHKTVQQQDGRRQTDGAQPDFKGYQHRSHTSTMPGFGGTAATRA